MAAREKAAKPSLQPQQAMSSQRVEDALAEIRRLYATGRSSLEPYPQRMGYGEMKSEAERLGYNPETLRKARAFKENYSEKELDTLCAHARKHQFAIPVSHVVRLQSVPTEHRTALQQELIQHKWSKRELDGEIRKRFGNRMPTAGRRRRALLSVADAE